MLRPKANMALGSTACTNDLNGDGTCTVVDVQRVINASLGSGCDWSVILIILKSHDRFLTVVAL